MKWAYLLINFFSILVPFIYSFDPRLKFYKNWKYLIPSTLIVGLIFIAWDVLFTKWGVWGFNPTYLIGMDLINLPIEEWLFFICIPYACVFTYECLFYFIKNPIRLSSRHISISLAFVLIIIVLFNLDKAYTSTALSLCAGLILVAEFVLKAQYLNRFYFSFLIILIPFFIVNGLLTGSWIPDQIVWYNDQENLGIRMGTIPVEDTFYGMAMLLGNVMIYEWLKELKYPENMFR